MNGKILILAIAIVAFVALSGCTEQVCGDGTCGTGEDSNSCPADCRTYHFCGNNVCETDESNFNSQYYCPGDCGLPTGGNIEVKVIDSATDQPIQGAAVTLSLAYRGTVVGVKTTDSYGKALFTDINSERYAVEATKNGYNPSEKVGVIAVPGRTVYATIELTAQRAVCGDGVCSAGEDANTCPADCCRIVCTNNAACNDNNSMTIDACLNPGTCSARCSHTTCPIACTRDLECNDNNAMTTDRCNNPGTCSATCLHTTIRCGNGVCEANENITNCPVDCNTSGEIVCASSDPSKINVKDANITNTPANGQKDFGTIILTNLTGGNLTSMALSSATDAFARNTATTLGLSTSYSSGAEITLTPDEMITGGTGKTTYSESAIKIGYRDYAGFSRNATITCTGPITVNNA